jgi:D-alanyl-D-alanine carboxypeptidase/D-alanyl-D-alanine-endopeptidase (penicillin-binding protein 4)
MRVRLPLLVVTALALVALAASLAWFDPGAGLRDGGVPAAGSGDGRGDGTGSQPVAGPEAPAVPPPPATEPDGDDRAADGPEPFARPELEARLQALLAAPPLTPSNARLAVAIRDEEGRVVLDHHADEPLLPASTMKLVTAASAMLTFGLDHRFTTVVGATAPVTRNGTVVGDLVLVGSGDPVLASPLYARWIYPARPRTPLEELADDVVAAGVERILGGVVGDGTSFSGPTVAAGWPDHYLWELDARHISGLTVDGGLGYAVDETVDPPQVTIRVAEQPAQLAAEVFARLLRDRGVTIEQGATAAAVSRQVVEPVAAVSGPALRDVLTHMVRRSDNQVADTLLQATALTRAGTGSWSMGALAARASLAGIDVRAPGVVIADGSGLSRDDRLTAAYLADLDATLGASELADDWWGLMAVAGQEGTLRRRLRGTLADGRFLGKTGTLGDVKAVAGVVLGPDERRYHLAVIANDARGADRTAVTVLMDELVLALAEDLHGCVRRPTAEATPGATPEATPGATSGATAGTGVLLDDYRLECPAGPVVAEGDGGARDTLAVEPAA